MNFLSKLAEIVRGIGGELEEEGRKESVERQEIQQLSESLEDITEDRGRGYGSRGLPEDAVAVFDEFMDVSEKLLEMAEELHQIAEEESEAESMIHRIIDRIKQGELSFSESQEQRLVDLNETEEENHELLVDEFQHARKEILEVENIGNTLSHVLLDLRKSGGERFVDKISTTERRVSRLTEARKNIPHELENRES
jgi:hypothetical protein